MHFILLSAVLTTVPLKQNSGTRTSICSRTVSEFALQMHGVGMSYWKATCVNLYCRCIYGLNCNITFKRFYLIGKLRALCSDTVAVLYSRRKKFNGVFTFFFRMLTFFYCHRSTSCDSNIARFSLDKYRILKISLIIGIVFNQATAALYMGSGTVDS